MEHMENIWSPSELSVVGLNICLLVSKKEFFSFSPLTPVVVLPVPTSKLQQHKVKSLTVLQDCQINVVEIVLSEVHPLRRGWGVGGRSKHSEHSEIQRL